MTIDALHTAWRHAAFTADRAFADANRAREKAEAAWAAYYEALMQPGSLEPLRPDIDELAAELERQKTAEGD